MFYWVPAFYRYRCVMRSQTSLSSMERRAQLLDFIRSRQRATVEEIATQFGVSPATVRRDLEFLASQGRLQRFHGGATVLDRTQPESPVRQRALEQQTEKQQIARLTAALIPDGETVFLGSGTTVLQVARQLRERRNLTVITNSLPVIGEFAGRTDFALVCLGGMLRHSELSMIGHLTEQALAELKPRIVVLGIRGLHAEHGLTNDYLPETMTDRAILAAGGKVIVVADHTKLGRVAAAFVAPVTAIQQLVTDSQAPDDVVEAVRATGVEVLIA